jgi:hypothetical protein
LKGICHMYRQWRFTETPTLELENSYVGVHGTDFVVEVIDNIDTVKVIDGVVVLSIKATGEAMTLRAGEKATATLKSLGQKVTFDATVEKRQWAGFYQRVQEKAAQK